MYVQELRGGQGALAQAQDLQCTHSGGGGEELCKRDTFPSPFIAGSPSHYQGSMPQEAGGSVEAFADTESIPNLSCLPANLPYPLSNLHG